MHRNALLAGRVAVLLAIAFTTASAQAPTALSAQVLSARKQKGSGFPDFGFMVTPDEYRAKYSDHPVFRLKADFPRDMPAHVPEFLEKIDFRKDPLGYIEAVRDYAFEGNLPDWDPYQNHVREWYHIPWLHPTTTGPNAYPPNGGTVKGIRYVLDSSAWIHVSFAAEHASLIAGKASMA